MEKIKKNKKAKKVIFSYIKITILFILSLLVIFLMSKSDVALKLLSGLAIFLLGMKFLEDGFKGFSGGVLEIMLRKFSETKLKSIAFGTVTTVIMQSSTLITILSLSFLSANLINLSQALGIVFGANLGSTTSGWIISGIGLKLDVSALGLPLITVGIIMLFNKSKDLKSLGYILAGIGLFFLGIAYIKDGFVIYQNAFNISSIRIEGVLSFALFLFIGIAITSLVQSSFATLTIIILALSSNSITYDNALALVIGINVGGVVTALIASISSSPEGKKLAIGNTIFNIIIAIVCVAFLPYFKDAVDFLTEFFGFDPENYALKIATFHTTYNVIAVVLMTPFINSFAGLLNRLVKSNEKGTDKATYINDSLLPYPTTAKEALRKEVDHLYENFVYILGLNIGVPEKTMKDTKLNKTDLEDLEWVNYDMKDVYDRKIRHIFDSIIDFSSNLSSYNNNDQFSKEIYALQNAARNIVEATKNIALLQSNIRKYSGSKNDIVKNKYEDIRIMLSSLIYDLNQIKNLNVDDASFEGQIKTLKSNFKNQDQIIIKEIEGLLSQNKIPVQNATTLLSDIAFSYDVSKEVIKSFSNIRKFYQYDLELPKN